MLLSEWMNKSRDERRAHLDLSTPCECGGHRALAFKRLSDHLGIDNDLESRSKTGMALHACACDSNHGACSNPLHLYFGTVVENRFDLPEDIRQKPGATSAEMGVGVHGRSTEQMTADGRAGGNKTKELGVGWFAPGHSSKAGKKGNAIANKTLWISLADGFISTAGPVGYHNKSIGAGKADKLRITPRDYLYLLPLTADERVETIKRRVAQPSTYQHQFYSS